MSTKRSFPRWLCAALVLLPCLLCLCCPNVRAQESGLSLTIEAPENIRCKTPVSFHLQGQGGSGVYGYKWGNADMMIDGRWEPVLDGAAFSVRIVDDPDFPFTFCAPGLYRFHFYLYDKGNGYAQYKRASIQVHVTDPSCPTVEEVVAQMRDECLAHCSTEFEKALWLHDRILETCDYDYSYLFDGPEGALVRGSGTCEAYHRAYVMVLNAVGIETARVEGNLHVWTAARLDGQWCQIDLTWDAGCAAKHTATTEDDYQLHLYFGLDDALMAAAHSDHKSNPAHPCNSLANQYFLKTGEITKWTDPLLPALQEKLDEGAVSFDLPIPPSNVNEVYYKLLYPVAAEYLSSQPWTVSGKAISLAASYEGENALHFTVSGPQGGGTSPSGGSEPDRPAFQDVPENAYYKDAVAWAVEHGITSGTSQTTFSPNAPCTRAQIVTFLWNSAGNPKAKHSASFRDVTPESWYGAAVSWAVEQGITSGTSPTTFSPDSPCTRAQAVTFLWNAAGYPGPGGESISFSDVKAGAYYEKAVQWAAEQQITSGVGKDRFGPAAACTRAQIVTFLYRASREVG